MRVRLTLLAVLATVVVVAMGVSLTYTLIGRQLVSHQQDDVLAQLDQFARSAAPVTTTQELADFTRAYLAGPESQSLRQRGLVLALLLPDRTLSNAADLALEKLPFSRPLLDRGEPVLGRVQAAQGTYLVAGRPIVLGGARVGGVEVAAPLASIGDVQRQVLFVLVLAGLLAILAVGGGSWLLLGQALDPVRRMTRTAAAISREDLSRRVEYLGPQDEVAELAATLNDMLARLDDAFRLQDRFISDVSHELRTPLTIVKGHLQVLDRQAEFDPERVREEHAVVLEELDRLNRLVEELLTLARLQRGAALEWGPVDVDGLLGTLVAQGEHLGDRRWQVDRLPGVTVEADKDRLTQALLNLMVNALNHTAPGEVIALGGDVVGAGTGAPAAPGPGMAGVAGWVTVWVRDEGSGMEPDVVERIFERFYRGDAPGSGGLGLGLAIVNGIAEAHGGRVDVSSAVGAGSRFTLTLPVRGDGSARKSSLIRPSR